MKYSIEDLRFYANNLGGRCLSQEYISIETPIEWCCKNGHVFTRSFHYIKNGYWCQKCHYVDFCERRITEIKQLAKSKGGSCLSNEYITNKLPLKFTCEIGHPFEISYGHLMKGQWCKACLKEQHRKNQYERLKALVQKKGGKVLSPTLDTKLTKINFLCKKGHTFRCTMLAIQNGVWCDTCKREKLFNEIKERIESKGGKVISKEYKNMRSKLTVECVNGHRRTADASDIRKEFSCTFCLRKKLKDEVHEFIIDWAKQNKGKVLTKIYKNSSSPMLFECEKGHKFKAEPRTMKHQRSWCQKCHFIRKKITD